jgi:tetratricopeptide (TPR) repeat protein
MRRPRADTILFNLLLLPFAFWGLQGADTDTFYHLASGRWMFENGRIMDRETFSFTNEGRPWTNVYWLFQCLLYGSWRLGGLDGVLVFRAVLLLTTGNLLLAWIRHRVQGRFLETLGFSLLAFSLLLARALNVRGHLFSYVFLLILLWRLERFGAGTRRFDPALPALCALWANCHGVEYPVALGVIAVYALAALAPHLRLSLGEAARTPDVIRWVGLAAACTLAFAVNPFGFGIFATARLATESEIVSQIAELQPLVGTPALGYVWPDFELWSTAAFNWVLVGGVLLCPRWIRQRHLQALGCFALGTALALRMGRFLPEFMILAVPFVAEGVARLRAPGGGRAKALGRILTAASAYLVVAVLIKLAPAARAGGGFTLLDPNLYPIGPVRFLEQQGLSGNVFCRPGAAGYVTWSLHPSRVRIFMDMRAPGAFGAQEAWLYSAVGETVPLGALQRRFGVDWLVVQRDTALAERVRADPAGFVPVWVDQRFLLYAHESRLAGREGLRLRSLDALFRIEGGVPLLPGDRPDQIAAEAGRLAETWPDNHLAQASLAWLPLYLNRPAEAQARAHALAAQHPRAAVYPYLEGLALAAQGREGEAVEALESARRREPEFLRPYPPLAEHLAVLDRVRAALDVMDDYARRRSFRLSAPEHVLQAWLRHRLGRLEEAEDAYSRALWQLAPGDPLRIRAETGLAAVWLDGGKPAPALALLDEAASRGPLSDEALRQRGRALEMLHRP